MNSAVIISIVIATGVIVILGFQDDQRRQHICTNQGANVVRTYGTRFLCVTPDGRVLLP